jgi:hypothetical protein
LVAAILLFLALPLTATAAATATPLTRGEVKRAIFIAPDRKIDVSQKGIAVAPPPAQPSQLQSYSQPTAPTKPVASAPPVRLWVWREGGRKRRLKPSSR